MNGLPRAGNPPWRYHWKRAAQRRVGPTLSVQNGAEGTQGREMEEFPGWQSAEDRLTLQLPSWRGSGPSSACLFHPTPSSATSTHQTLTAWLGELNPNAFVLLLPLEAVSYQLNSSAPSLLNCQVTAGGSWREGRAAFGQGSRDALVFGSWQLAQISRDVKPHPRVSAGQGDTARGERAKERQEKREIKPDQG